MEEKLAAARIRLILDRPFLGSLALRLPLVPAKWCRSIATDAKSLYYNPEYMGRLSVDQIAFAIAHEAMHCALSHFSRRGNRVKSRWDIACDHAVNSILHAEGLKPPPGTLIMACFEGMTAEEIYPFVEEEGETMDEHLFDEGGGEGESSSGGKPKNPSKSEKEALANMWRQHLIHAVQQAEKAGKLEGLASRMAGEILHSKLPWRMMLARHLSRLARDDYSYARPSRREGEALLPSLRSHDADLAVAIDVSGSVSEMELNEFISEIEGMKGQLRAAVTLIACDENISEIRQYEPWEELVLPESFRGGGGTDFRPVFEWLEENPRGMLVYFTDALGIFPESEPSHPVLWLVKGSAPVPWGTRIQLN